MSNSNGPATPSNPSAGPSRSGPASTTTTGNANSGTPAPFTGLGTTSTSGSADSTVTPKPGRPFRNSFFLMSLLLLGVLGTMFGLRHYLQLHNALLDPDPNVVFLAAPSVLLLSLVFAGVSLWRKRQFKRSLGVLLGSVCGSIIPLTVVAGMCFVTVECRYRAADGAKPFFSADRPEYDFAREYHAINIATRLRNNADAAQALATLDAREKELGLGIAILRGVEDGAGICHAATDTAVNQIHATGHFPQQRAAAAAKVLSPEQVTRLKAIESAACYMGHDVRQVQEVSYFDCAFSEQNLRGLKARLDREYPLWRAVHVFVQANVPSLTTTLLP